MPIARAHAPNGSAPYRAQTELIPSQVATASATVTAIPVQPRLRPMQPPPVPGASGWRPCVMAAGLQSRHSNQITVLQRNGMHIQRPISSGRCCLSGTGNKWRRSVAGQHVNIFAG